MSETNDREEEEKKPEYDEIRSQTEECMGFQKGRGFWIYTYPSRNTAAKASPYVILPLPWNPTTEYENFDSEKAGEVGQSRLLV